MKIKTTMKLGDRVDVFDNVESSFGSDEQTLQQMMTFKAYMGMITNLVEKKDPEMKDKRIEIIIELEDDRFYLVVGRKPKEERIEFGT